MTRRGRWLVLPWLALALLLQAYAVVRSVAMNAPGGMSMCPLHASAGVVAAPISMGPGEHHHMSRGGMGGHAACPYCDVAAHVPVFTSTPTIPRAGGVAYATFFPPGRRGARGPPRIRPKARAPPAVPA